LVNYSDKIKLISELLTHGRESIIYKILMYPLNNSG